MATRHYRRVHKPVLLENLETDAGATVYGLEAFARAVGCSYGSLRSILAPGLNRKVHKSWCRTTEEKIQEIKEYGGHLYYVYGYAQDVRPTEEQLDNPPLRPARELRDTVQRPKSKTGHFLSPQGIVFLVYGIVGFCETYDLWPEAVSAVKADRQRFFYKKGDRVDRYTTAVPGAVKIVNRRWTVGSRKVRWARPKEAWRKSTFLEVIPAVKHNDFKTVIHGVTYDGRPSDAKLQAHGVTWEQVCPKWALGAAP